LLGLPLVTGGIGAAWGSRLGENNWAHKGENPADPGGVNASMLGAAWGGLGGAGLGLIPGLINKYEMRNGGVQPRQEYLKRWKGYTGLDHLIEEEKTAGMFDTLRPAPAPKQPPTFEKSLGRGIMNILINGSKAKPTPPPAPVPPLGKSSAAGNDALAWLMSIDNVNTPDPDDLDYDERSKRAMLTALNNGVRKQCAVKSASLERMLTSALVSAGGGLALGAYPGWQLQQASARAGNPEFVNSFVGRIPIAAAGALSGGLYNYLREQQEAEAKKKLTVPAAN
jgi:hypothetical protein